MNNEPVAWMVRRDDNITKGYGKEIQLTLMDATKPEFWVKGKIAKGYEVFPLYTHPAKTLTNEEIKLIKEVVGDYVCTLKMEIDQQKQTFKGYEHCSNLSGLNGELKDAEKALAILKKAQEK